MNKKKAAEDLKDSLLFLKDAIDHYSKGENSFHKLIAIQLYALLYGKNSLINKMFSGIELAKVVPNPLEYFKNTLKILPDTLIIGREVFNENKLVEYQLFVHDDALPLNKWMQQTILVTNKQEVSIEKIIKDVRNKSGAHFDPDFAPSIKSAQLVSLANQKLHEALIFSIGVYVSQVLDDVIKKYVKF